MPKCGAHSKSTGNPCTRTAMANGRCYVHGGNTPETNQNAVTHGFYSRCYTEEEKENLKQSKIGSLVDEIHFARTQLARAASKEEGDEHYRPDLIEKWTNTIGRLEKQHAEITADQATDELDWISIARIGVALTEEVDSVKTTSRTNKTDD